MLNCTVFKINKYQNVKRAYINKKTKKILKKQLMKRFFFKSIIYYKNTVDNVKG